MELQSLLQQYETQFTQNKKIQVKEKITFSIPVHALEVSYKPVVRSAMDILMKMMLISFQKAQLKNAEMLAEILLVEPLFIRDLTQKMQKIGLITFDETYKLTPKGIQQLQNGIFEDELEEQLEILHYSPLHGQHLTGDLEEILEFDEIPPVSAYTPEELGDIDHQQLLAFLQAQQPAPEEGEQQLYVTSITNTTSVQINDVPCLQYVLYEAESDRFYCRIYNTLTQAWDETIETLFNEKLREHWRKTYA